VRVLAVRQQWQAHGQVAMNQSSCLIPWVLF